MVNMIYITHCVYFLKMSLGIDPVSSRLKAARVAAGYAKATDAVRKFRWNQSTYLAHENGQNGVKPKTALIYAKAFKVDAGWILTGHGKGVDGFDYGSGEVAPPASNIVEINGTEFARIPIYDIRFAAGAGSQNYSELPDDHYLMSRHLLRRYTDAPVNMIAAFWVAGDSMHPTIDDGDLCVADLRRTQLTNPGIYAMIFEGEGLLKRAAQHLETKAVTLISDNEKYPAQTISQPDQLKVVGRIIASVHRH